jgi:hypothetical protein
MSRTLGGSVGQRCVRHDRRLGRGARTFPRFVGQVPFELAPGDQVVEDGPYGVGVDAVEKRGDPLGGRVDLAVSERDDGVDFGDA